MMAVIWEAAHGQLKYRCITCVGDTCIIHMFYTCNTSVWYTLSTHGIHYTCVGYTPVLHM